MGELSSGRQALEGADLAPGNDWTLATLQDPSKHPPRIRLGDELPVTEFAPEIPFEVDEKKFLTNLRTSRRGAAAGPSGMTTEHLRLVLDTVQDAQLLFKLGEKLSRAETNNHRELSAVGQVDSPPEAQWWCSWNRGSSNWAFSICVVHSSRQA